MASRVRASLDEIGALRGCMALTDTVVWPMPKIPDDMSSAAIKRRAESSEKALAKAKAKALEPKSPPKPIIAKKR